ncbi:MAG: SprT-like domain-containing protein [Novosphingobium sp.]|nr:SprT-like domain-containing protein [Novosphingobium sp.]
MSGVYTPITGAGFEIRPTQETYEALTRAYDHFNWVLFGNELPGCLITLQRKGRTYGYFCRDRFARQDGATCDEIALNPAYFAQQGAREVCATLVHEMVHLWQYHFGQSGRGRYHNRQWAEKMKSVGLYPSHTGQPGGRETGDQMMDYIIEDGPLARAYAELEIGGFAIEWQDSRRDADEPPVGGTGTARPGKPVKGGKRVKYTCPVCGLNAWARHQASIMCGVDRADITPT